MELAGFMISNRLACMCESMLIPIDLSDRDSWERSFPKAMIVSLVLTLYSLVSLWSVWAIKQNAGAVVATACEMKRLVAERGSTLGRVPRVSMPDYMMPVLPKLVASIAFVAYLGSIVFFSIREGWHGRQDLRNDRYWPKAAVRT